MWCNGEFNTTTLLGPGMKMNISILVPSLASPSLTTATGDSLGRALEQQGEHLKQVAVRELGADLATKVGASDVVQDTFFAASRDFPSYRGKTPGEFRGWLEGILRNRLSFLRRHFRKVAKRQVSREVSIDQPGAGMSAQPNPEIAATTTMSPLSRVVQIERIEALRSALDDLTARDREVILLHHQNRMTFEQVGQQLAITEDAARKRWVRAIVRLRDVLDPNHDSQ